MEPEAWWTPTSLEEGRRGRGATTGQKSAEGRPEPRGGARKDPAPRQAAGCKGLGVPDARLSPASACELVPVPQRRWQ